MIARRGSLEVISDSEPERRKQIKTVAPTRVKSEFTSAKMVMKAQKKHDDKVLATDNKRRTIIELHDSPEPESRPMPILTDAASDLNDAVVKLPSPTTMARIYASTTPINYFATDFEPATSSSTSQSKSKYTGKGKGKAKAKAESVPSSVDTIDLPLLSPIDACPVCKAVWPLKKTNLTKLKHVVACAEKNSWTLATVKAVLLRQLRMMEEEHAVARRKAEDDQTLFQSIVGGSGQIMRVGKQAEVRVVGLDRDGAIAATQGGSLKEATTIVQVRQELDNDKKKARKAKAGPSKATKLGKAISVLDGDAETSKISYGTLKTFNQTADLMLRKAEAIIAQVPRIESSPRCPQGNTDSSTEQDNNKIPATQPLNPSKLAEKFKPTLPDADPRASQLEAAKARAGGNTLWSLAGGVSEPVSPIRGGKLSRPLSAQFSSSKRGISSKTPASATTAAAMRQDRSNPASESDSDHSISSSTSYSSNESSCNSSHPTSSSSEGTGLEAAAQSSSAHRPDYGSWELKALQKETAKYGYKRPTTVSACVQTLNKVWDALHPADEEPARAKGKRKSTSSSSRKKPRTSNVSMASAGEFMDEADDVALGLDARDASIEAEAPDFTSAMRRAVLKEAELYNKIIHYQPVAFEDFVKLAKDNSIKATAISLRRFLDQEAITFYQETQLAKRNSRQKKKHSTRKKRVSK